MKKILAAVLITTALLTSTFGYSSDAKPGKIITKEIPVKSSFQKIEMGSNLHLVLIQDASVSAITVTGDESLVRDIKVNLEKGVLSIATKKSFRNKEVTIYVPVTTLASIDLGRGTSVTTDGIIKMDGLRITVHVGSKVNLNVIGDFDVESGDDCDFVFEKYEKSSVVYVHD